MKHVIVIPGALSGVGICAARALAHAGHIVYAGIRETGGRGAAQVAGLHKYAAGHGVDLRTIELDVASQASVDAAIEKIVADNGRLDVVIQNAGYMAFGSADAFTSEKFAQLYDVNVLGTQRVNRAALPQLRKQGQGLLIWISSNNARSGTPPYLAPCFTATAAMDSLAVSYADKLADWGIETAIVVPGYAKRENCHDRHAASLIDKVRASLSDGKLHTGSIELDLDDKAASGSAEAEATAVADAIARVVNLPPGKRPFRTHINAPEEASDVVHAVAGWVRHLSIRRFG